MDNYMSSESESETNPYTIDDYLNNSKTHAILEENFFNTFENKMYDVIEEFYQTQVNDCIDNYMDVFDKDYFAKEAYEFFHLIYPHVTKNYDTSIFDDDPEFAKSLLVKKEEVVKKKKETPKIIETKKYDWGSKSYK